MNNLKISYPPVTKASLFLHRVRQTLKWLFILALVACPVINIITGAPAWSVVAVLGVFFVWKVFLSPDVLERGPMNYLFTFTAFAMIQTALIGLLLSPGWLGFVLPIMGFSTLILSVLFFYTASKRRQDGIIPLLSQTIAALIAVGVIYLKDGELSWPMVVLGTLSLVLLVMGSIAYHTTIAREIRKYFHTR